MVTMICAMTPSRVIGTAGGGIPWHLPRDIEHFRTYTDGKHMLLGRKTFEEMTGWFTTQTPLVLTSNDDYQPALGSTVSSIDEAIRIGNESVIGELVVSGGAQVYAAALPFADRLVLTIVDTDIQGAAHFPDYESSATWTTASQESFPADDVNPFALTFLTLDRAY